jgi:hypothetical protein
MRPIGPVAMPPCGRRGAAIISAWIPYSLIGLLVVAMGCATTPGARADVTGAVTWRVTAFQRVPVTVRDRPGERYTFTLLLSEQAGRGITFTRVTQTVSAAQVQPMTRAQDGEWSLPPKGQLLLPFHLVWSCPAMPEACSAAAGSPHWHILLTGTDEGGTPVQLSLEVDVPVTGAMVAST